MLTRCVSCELPSWAAAVLIARAGARSGRSVLLNAVSDARDPIAGARRTALLIMLAVSIDV